MRGLFASIRRDVDAALERDPAARSAIEVVLAYPGFHSRQLHRLAHAHLSGAMEIGEGRGVGLGSVVVTCVPPYSTVVGVPGRAVGVRYPDRPVARLPDPEADEIERLERRLAELEMRLAELEQREA